MILASMRVLNFRSIKDETLECDALTALVGANGSGKSSFLRALELFYSPTPRVDTDDFYAGDISQEITIALTYRDLTSQAATDFAAFTANSSLTVERVFTAGGGKASSKYFGSTLQHSAFQPVRDGLTIKDRGQTARAAYDVLRSGPQYQGLAAWTTIANASSALTGWEAANPDLCTRARDEGQFFGFVRGAKGFLGRYTQLLYIPAVRDAARDAEEGRGSVLTTLMDLVVRNAIAGRPALLRLKRRSQLLYERAMNPAKIPELVALGNELTGTLRTLVPDASVDLQWKPLDTIALPLPTADIKLVEDGYPSAVERTGHGLQRAFIITMLQHLAMAQVSGAAGPDGAPSADKPSLILAIEEPELYQHPNRQRHFAQTLGRLASGVVKGVAERTQVIYGTHSPLFVSIDRIHQLRLLRRVGAVAQSPKVTKVIRTNLTEVADTLWDADGRPTPRYTGQTLLPRLRTVMTPSMSEGFFAEVAILVEGEDDRAALLGAASFLGHDLETGGFAIIACNGKTCLDRPFVVFRKLGIPVYLVWDSDKGNKEALASDNHRLLRLLGEPATDWPAIVTDNYACFEADLEATVRSEVGEALYDSLLATCQKEFGIRKKKHAQKNPSVVRRIIEDAHQQGATCSTLKAIVEKVWALR